MKTQTPSKYPGNLPVNPWGCANPTTALRQLQPTDFALQMRDCAP